MTKLLAEEEGVGRVFVCQNCSDVHVRWKDWMFKLDEESFQRFFRMVQVAAELQVSESGKVRGLGATRSQWEH